MKISILAILAILALVPTHGSRAGGGTRTQLRSRISRGSNGDCSYSPPDKNYGIQSIGSSGQVRFYRDVNRTSRNGRRTGTVRRYIAVIPYRLREVNTNGATVRRAAGFRADGTTITWNCNVTTETGLDVNGSAITADVLESDWSATRQVFTGISGGTAQTQSVTLGFNVKLFAQPWVVDMCPRRYNASGFGQNAFRWNHTNCSAVEIPGAGLKWAFLIQNWPYANAANHLELDVSLRIGGGGSISRRTSSRRGQRVLRRRRQIASQILSFGDGFLDNPEEVEEMCSDGSSTFKTIGIQDTLTGGGLNIKYTFPSPTNRTGCDFFYDPVMNNTQGDTTNGVGRTSAITLAVFVVLGCLFV